MIKLFNILKFVYMYSMMTVVIPMWFVIPSLFSVFILGENKEYFEYIVKLAVEYVLRPTYIISGEPLITNGIILANHVSIYDGWFDKYSNGTYSICRRLYVVIMIFMGLIGYVEDSGIIINRDKIKPGELVSIMTDKIDKKSILLYPEGTRKQYYIDKNVSIDKSFMQKNIKYGTLIEIYKNDKLKKHPIQIIITMNKEKTNESLYSYRSKPFFPKDFESQESYIDHILDEWIISYNKSLEMYLDNNKINK